MRVLELKAHRRLGGPTVIYRFIKFGLWLLMQKLLGRRDARKTAVEARLLFQGLGGLWVKLGQLLSLRTDVLSDEMCEELSHLLYANVGFPSHIVRQAIEQELGRPIDEIFASFEDTPLAAASIAQVHRAVLRKERLPVVVKLLRPNVIHAFRRDMGILRAIASVANALLPIRHLRLQEGLNELDSMVEEELNYAYEVSNSRQLRKVLRRHNVYVPYIFRQYCTEKVLVMEEIAGVLMSDAIAVQARDPERFADWCEENSIEPKRVAMHLFLSHMRQLLEDNIFHGDMHPGNILLLRDNRYALIDFGTIGSLDPGFLQTYLGFMRAISRREYDKAADLSLHLCAEIPSTDIGKIRAELINAFKLWQSRSKLSSHAYGNRSLADSSKVIGEVFAKHRLQINWAALRMGRTMGTLDTSLAYFYPQMSHSRMLSRYLRKSSRRRKKHALENMREGLGRFVETANDYRVLLEPIAQRAVISYKQKLNKFSMIAATVMRFFNIALLSSIALGGYAFIHQHYFDMSHMPGADLIDDIPHIEKEWFLLALLGLAMLFATFKRIITIVSSAYLR
ncbi:ABC1 kinase family protein [Methylogaea oryzae]|uniref:ABC1 kinase family protein n=1 Tax=Methylogaea oryzae TaxID=1295382 RepID=UPI0006D0EAAE|nr:AarF/UbiB family protein [Methylogaea oryzae]